MFALTLCAYLAHCERAGGLTFTEVPEGEAQQQEGFFPFFAELNGWLIAEMRESRRGRDLCVFCGDGCGGCACTSV